MRLDLFLKRSRLVKRRSLAKELCDEGVVRLNGKPARAGHSVAEGDELILDLRNRRLAVTVIALPDSAASAARPGELYEVVADERVEE
ncbi:MAG TPA: RNA-binding S4 domain-containing protein [Vicinamibacteria bacterium]|nr:RNA-binding S4 domain-containing protein [Vicinamibacteria bacterium]